MRSVDNIIPNVITIRKPKAAKEHVCTLCKDPILIEEIYINAECAKIGQGLITIKACEKHQVDDVVVIIKNQFKKHMRRHIKIRKLF